MTDIPPPADALRLAARLTAEGWRVRTRPSTGTVPAQRHGLPRGDGTRPTHTVQLPCHSFGVAAAHPHGRGFWALWLHIDGNVSAKTGKPSWSFDDKAAWRVPEPHEHGPKPLTWATLRAYTAPATERKDVA